MRKLLLNGTAVALLFGSITAPAFGKPTTNVVRSAPARPNVELLRNSYKEHELLENKNIVRLSGPGRHVAAQHIMSLAKNNDVYKGSSWYPGHVVIKVVGLSKTDGESFRGKVSQYVTGLQE